MTWRLFKEKKRKVSGVPLEPTTMDRLLQGNCGRDELFLLYSKLLQERFPESTTQFIGESVLRIVNEEGKELTCYLDNFWLRYSEGNEDRRDLIEQYVRVAAGNNKTAGAKRENIVAMIKDSSYLPLLGGTTRWMTEHLCGDLWIIYAVDEPDRTNVLGREEMTAAGISRAELRPLAIENLKRILPAIQRHGGGPWYLLTAGANYVASLLLFDDMWDQLADSVDGEIVATVPCRDVLLYTGSHSVEGIASIREKTQEIAKRGPHAISDSLIVREGGEWAIFNAN